MVQNFKKAKKYTNVVHSHLFTGNKIYPQAPSEKSCFVHFWNEEMFADDNQK